LKIFLRNFKKQTCVPHKTGGSSRHGLSGFFCRRRLKAQKAASVIEYVSLVVFVLAAFYVMEGYIIRGILGKWKQAGEVFGHGRQYDPRDFSEDELGGTIECLYYYDVNGLEVDGFWMDQKYYEENCDCFLPEDHPDYQQDCVECREEAGETRLAELCSEESD